MENQNGLAEYRKDPVQNAYLEGYCNYLFYSSSLYKFYCFLIQ
jgi:hypothetical protein